MNEKYKIRKKGENKAKSKSITKNTQRMNFWKYEEKIPIIVPR